MSRPVTPVTLVTGASRGIGAACALACAEAGHAVAVNFRAEAEKAAEVVASIEAAGGRAMAVQADTSDEGQVSAMFDAVTRDLGPVTGLVNNAGVHGPRLRVEDMAAADIDHVLGVNVRGYFLCAREAVRRMSTERGGQGGAIVNVSSGSAHLGGAGGSILYAASKGAVNSLTIGLAQEVAAEGIRVNTVAPGMTETDMPGADRLAEQARFIPQGRIAQPEEIAEAVLWLLSDKAGHVCGANLRVAGGRL